MIKKNIKGKDVSDMLQKLKKNPAFLGSASSKRGLASASGS